MGKTLHYETTAEAAQRLGVSRRQIQKWLKQGKLEGRKIGRDYVIEAGAEPELSRKRREK